MYYSILIYGAEGVFDRLSQEEQERQLEGHRSFQAELAAEGKLGPVAQLMGTTTAMTLRASNNNVLVTDGPFAESKEHFLGFYVIECDSMQEAIETAKKLPLDMHSIEIRPINWLGGTTLNQHD